MDRASTLTTILVSYNASKRGINCYPKPHSKRHQPTFKKFTLPLPTSIK
ncbi:unnamed protein product [Brassica rapa subsp. narinosa]